MITYKKACKRLEILANIAKEGAYTIGIEPTIKIKDWQKDNKWFHE